MKYFIKTFGCQMNVADSALINNHLMLRNMKQADDFKSADVIVVNTCTVRAMAEHKALSFLGEVKKRTKGKKVVVVGCAAEQWGKSIISKYPSIEFVLGAKDIEQFPSVFDRSFGLSSSLNAKRSTLNAGVTAFVTIMRGCDNYCSYCIVPYVRGRETSRPSKEIIAEIKTLVKNGVKEVTLLGQNVNSYNSTYSVERKAFSKTFPELLEEINKIEGLERIRFMTSHPKDLSRKLIEIIKKSDKMCKHVHLPLQSGSDKILKKMNRKYTSKKYMKIIDNLKKAVPGISITTDILVGFPGETKKDFDDTLKIIKKADFDFLFAFKYSPRPGTNASKLKDDVPQEEKNSRVIKVLELANRISKQKNAKLIGTIQEVLVDETKDGISTGSTSSNKKVFINADIKPGTIVNVKIIESKINSLKGEMNA